LSKVAILIIFIWLCFAK